MSVTYTEASAEMFGLLLEVWEARAATIFGQPSTLYMQDIGQQNKIPGDAYWGRVSRQTIDDEQSSLSACVGAPGSKRYEAMGLVFVQLFGPRSDTRANHTLALMAMELRNALRRGKAGGSVWYRKPRINELPVEDKYVRVNVVAEFNYDEVF